MKKVLSGRRYRDAHQQSVNTILGDRAPKVISKGSRFYHRAFWPLRSFAEKICKRGGASCPTEKRIKEILLSLYKAVPTQIIIANTPDDLPPGMASALIGGAYHEAWHGLYTLQETPSAKDLYDVLEKRWGKFPLKKGPLLQWSNITEDIRIERVGTKEFPGTRRSLEYLQDFILEQERKISRPRTFLETVMGLFRDIGLGYQTDLQLEVLDGYREQFPEAADFVERGPLAPLLRKNINLKGDQKIASFEIALDILIALEEAKKPQLEIPPLGEKGESQEGNPQGGDGSQEGGETPPKRSISSLLRGEGETSSGMAIMDANGAFEEAIQEDAIQEDKDLSPGERAYRPYRTDLDQIQVVHVKNNSVSHVEKKLAETLTFLTSRLRSILLAAEISLPQHGTRRGKLSGRRLIDTAMSVRRGHVPERPFWRQGQKIDTSVSVAIVLDQSGSMNRRKHIAREALIALTKTFSDIGCPTLALGVREGEVINEDIPDRLLQYHRYKPVNIDIYKGFAERWGSVRTRFGHSYAAGSTPLSDGIQYALEALSDRPEGHRLVFVITDGEPDHPKVVRHQVRIAKESGIQCVGIGLGISAQYVQDLFPVSVYDRTGIQSMAKPLVHLLNDILDFRAQGRYRRLKSTG